MRAMSAPLPALLLCFACLCACAHPSAVRSGGKPLPASAAPAEAAPPAAASSPSRDEMLAVIGEKAGERPAALQEEEPAAEDEFIETDDRRGLVKSWPMLLFLLLAGAAAGYL